MNEWFETTDVDELTAAALLGLPVQIYSALTKEWGLTKAVASTEFKNCMYHGYRFRVKQWWHDMYLDIERKRIDD